MNRQEFVDGYSSRSRVTLEGLADAGRGAFPCDCSVEECEGWQMANAEEYAAMMTVARQDPEHSWQWDPSSGADTASLAGIPEWGPYCDVHGCRGRWWPELPHTLCDKAGGNSTPNVASDGGPQA